MESDARLLKCNRKEKYDFTKVDALVKDIDVDKYHIETVILSSDDLKKKLFDVKSVNWE